MIQPDVLAELMEHTAAELRHLGKTTWGRAEDWQKTRAISRDSTRGGGVGTGRSDRTIEDQREDDAAAARYDELRTLTARMDADARRMRWLLTDSCPDKPRLERVNTVPACIVCAGPALPVKRGMCQTDYMAWRRAGQPDLESFKRVRHREQEAAKAVVHEHEQAS